MYKDENNAEQKKNSVNPKTNDVVTMVSLISSADNDSDIDSSNEDKLINELRNKLSTTSIIKTSINTSSGTTRKPIKSGIIYIFFYILHIVYKYKFFI